MVKENNYKKEPTKNRGFLGFRFNHHDNITKLCLASGEEELEKKKEKKDGTFGFCTY